jgi:hypothetical protein
MALAFSPSLASFRGLPSFRSVALASLQLATLLGDGVCSAILALPQCKIKFKWGWTTLGECDSAVKRHEPVLGPLVNGRTGNLIPQNVINRGSRAEELYGVLHVHDI